MNTSRSTPHLEARRWFYAAMLLAVCSFVLYIYFVSASVVHVVMRKEVDRDIASLSSYVSQLESQYIEVQHEVSADIATHKGFVKAEQKIFIDRSDTTVVLSRN